MKHIYQYDAKPKFLIKESQIVNYHVLDGIESCLERFRQNPQVDIREFSYKATKYWLTDATKQILILSGYKICDTENIGYFYVTVNPSFCS